MTCVTSCWLAAIANMYTCAHDKGTGTWALTLIWFRWYNPRGCKNHTANFWQVCGPGVPHMLWVLPKLAALKKQHAFPKISRLDAERSSFRSTGCSVSPQPLLIPSYQRRGTRSEGLGVSTVLTDTCRVTRAAPSSLACPQNSSPLSPTHSLTLHLWLQAPGRPGCSPLFPFPCPRFQIKTSTLLVLLSHDTPNPPSTTTTQNKEQQHTCTLTHAQMHDNSSHKTGRQNGKAFTGWAAFHVSLFCFLLRSNLHFIWIRSGSLMSDFIKIKWLLTTQDPNC